MKVTLNQTNKYTKKFISELSAGACFLHNGMVYIRQHQVHSEDEYLVICFETTNKYYFPEVQRMKDTLVQLIEVDWTSSDITLNIKYL